MTINRLLAPALLAALGMSSAHASSEYSNWFEDPQIAGTVTFKLSGYCKGSVSLPLSSKPYARIQTGPSYYASSYFYASLDTGGPSIYIGSDFESDYTGSSAALSIHKGNLKFTAKTNAVDEGYLSIWGLHTTSLGTTATCKNGQTFSQLINGFSNNVYFLWDNSLKHQANFKLQGKQAPFKYTYTQKSSGILEVPQKCKVAGDNTYNLATDSYKATCKLDPVIKLSISTNLKGEMNYD